MKIAFFSDTHTIHERWYSNLREDVRDDFDSADMLIFTGDYSDTGSYKDTESFCRWFHNRPNRYKIMIAGNHDFFFDTEISKRNPAPRTNYEIEELLGRYNSIIYLNNSDVTIEDITIWGSPINKWFYDWAFNRHEGADIKRYWDTIPNNTDILLTHGPSYGVQDLVIRNGTEEHLGDRDLQDAIERVKPKIFASGHIHEGYGEEQIGKTLFINSCSLDGKYNPMNDPIIVFTEVFF